MDDSAILEIVRRAKTTPDALRTLDLGTTEAHAIYRLDAATLGRLIDFGFPHISDSSSLTFDQFDLANASLFLRLWSPRYLAMRRWPEALSAAARGRGFTYAVEILEYHPMKHSAAQEEDSNQLVVSSSLSARFPLDRLDRGVRLRYRTPKAPVQTATQELLAAMRVAAELEFHFIPRQLRQDKQFARERRLADCELATAVIVNALDAQGWTARVSFGLLLSTPYSLEHFWPEVLLDGAWTAFDPHLIRSLESWGICKPGSIPPDRGLNSTYLRVGEEWEDLLSRDGRPVATSFLTRRVDD